MRNDKFGFAVLGCGVISSAHLGAIAACPEAGLVAVCDIDEAKGRKCAADNGNVTFYKNYLEMVKDPAVDVVCICTPSGLHADGVIAAAKAGKHVFCEKPLDITYDRMCRMIEAVDKANVKMGCVFQGRTEQHNIAARQAIMDGQLGKMTLGDGFMKYYRSRAYYASAGWRGTWALDGGGALMNQGVHGIDLLMWIMNSPVERVFARMDHLVRDIEVEDTCTASLLFKNGALGTIIGTTSCNPGEPRRLEFHGDRGTICISESKITRFAKTTEPDGLAKDQQEKDGDPGEALEGATNNPANFGQTAHTFLVNDLVQAIKEDRDPYITGRSARRAVDLILAIYESARSGKDVQVKYGD
jgi:predicted dehydrogenase